jgi:TatA/E family protein of Tat protein translocase
MPQDRKKHTVHQMQIGRFSIKFLLEDFVMIGHESPKFGQRCPTKPGVNLTSLRSLRGFLDINVALTDGYAKCGPALDCAPSAVVESRRKETSMFEGLLQPIHLFVILAVAILLFGPKKLPELGKGLGEGIRGFKKAMTEHNEEK